MKPLIKPNYLFKQLKVGKFKHKIQNNVILLFASFPGSAVPSNFYFDSFVCKNSLIRKCFPLMSSVSFIRGNISVTALDLRYFEDLSFKDILAFRSLLQTYRFHAIYFSGFFQPVSSLVSTLSVVSEMVRY